jgi:hypothetical protein
LEGSDRRCIAAKKVEDEAVGVSAANKDMGISQGPAAELGRSCGLRYTAHSRGHRPIYGQVSQGIPGYPPAIWVKKDIRNHL